jgi:multimeric flavodoxin WrbA
MKVLLINGSPHQNGCTYTALSEVEKTLQEEGLETEIIHIGSKPIQGCTACGHCYTGPDRCVFDDDLVNRVLEKGEQADAFVFGSPVYYASANGSMIAFMDRLFYSGNCFALKPGACVVSARRAGTTAALDQMLKYLTISNMMVVGSQYWAMVHGNKPEDVQKDLEGMQIMRTLGRNMAWLLKCIEAGKQTGIPLPEREKRQWTNFIR